VLKKLQVPQCTTSRPVQPAHYFKWEHLRRKGGLSKHSSKHFSRERDTRKGYTRGATKEATGFQPNEPTSQQIQIQILSCVGKSCCPVRPLGYQAIPGWAR